MLPVASEDIKQDVLLPCTISALQMNMEQQRWSRFPVSGDSSRATVSMVIRRRQALRVVTLKSELICTMIMKIHQSTNQNKVFCLFSQDVHAAFTLYNLCLYSGLVI